MAAVKKEQAPIAFYTLMGRAPSGWTQEDTVNMSNPIVIDAPLRRNIPNHGWRKMLVKEEQEDGSVMEYHVVEEIRYIKNQSEIRVKEQNRLGIKPSTRPMNDWISFLKGDLTVKRDGSFIGMFDFLESTSNNDTNEDRIEAADAIFRKMNVVEDAETLIDFDEIQDEAKRKVRSWWEKVDGKKIYNEEKIKIAAQTFGIYADTIQEEVTMLLEKAHQMPKDFLEKLAKLEQTSMTEVTQALQLGVVEFVGNVAMYKEAGKGSIYNLGAGKLKLETKIEKLSNWFLTNEGQSAYEIFLSELDSEKQDKLTND